jgi:hypothetical protein
MRLTAVQRPAVERRFAGHRTFSFLLLHVALRGRRDDAPHGAANGRETVIHTMQRLPEAEREHHRVLDRFAGGCS